MSRAQTPPLRRMHATVTVVFVIAVAIAGGVQLVIATEPWWHAVTLAPSVGAAIWIASRWDRRPAPVVLASVLLLGEVTWAVAVLISGVHCRFSDWQQRARSWSQHSAPVE